MAAKNQKAKNMMPRRVGELQRAQLVHVAQTQFATTLNPKARLGELADEVRNLLSTIVQCDCEGCNGSVCNPELHILQPSEYQPESSSVADDVGNLLQTSQQDRVITPSGSPSLPLPDAGANRLVLGQLALDQLGVTANELLDHELLQDDPPLHTIPEELEENMPENPAPQSQQRSTTKSVVKGLSNAVKSLLSAGTPRLASPGVQTPSTTMVRPGTPAGPTGPRLRLPGPAPPRLPSLHIPPANAPPRPSIPAAAPVASGQEGLADTVDQLIKFVSAQADAANRERDEERRLRSEQLRNQQALSQVLENLANKTEGPASTSAAKGRTLVPHPNSEALALTGCAVAPQYAIHGDLSSVDLKDNRFKIKSGRNVGVTQEAMINETWPNQYLCPLMMDGLDPKQFDHDKITLIQWAGGFVGKIFAEFRADLNGTKEHNQLFILMKMLRLAEVQPWSEIMKINQALFSALERGVLTWLSRPDLERWWALALESLHNRALKVVPSKRPAATPLGGAPPAKKLDVKDKKKDMFGVTGEFLRQKNICIRWNISSCSESSSPHTSPDRSATEPVHHICGGCAFLGKSDTAAHPMRTCKFKNADGIFR